MLPLYVQVCSNHLESHRCRLCHRKSKQKNHCYRNRCYIISLIDLVAAAILVKKNIGTSKIFLTNSLNVRTNLNCYLVEWGFNRLGIWVSTPDSTRHPKLPDVSCQSRINLDFRQTSIHYRFSYEKVPAHRFGIKNLKLWCNQKFMIYFNQQKSWITPHCWAYLV